MLASLWRRTWPVGIAQEQVEAMYAELGATHRAEVLLETFKEEAIRSLHELENHNLKGLLRRTVGKIFNDVEIKGWCKEHEQLNQATFSRPVDVVTA
jgi:geranylgeranyl diphosphate synthase type II